MLSKLLHSLLFKEKIYFNTYLHTLQEKVKLSTEPYQQNFIRW